MTIKKTCSFKLSTIISSTLLLGVIATLSHFAYDLSGGNQIVGLFNPINESVWEHLKFMFFPFLIWWIVVYKIKSNTCATTLYTWIVAAAVSLVTAPLVVALLFYGYTGALGIESLSFDVLLTYIGYFIALLVGSHLLKYGDFSKWSAILSVIVVVVIFILFIVFTINPPQLPMFIPTCITM